MAKLTDSRTISRMEDSLFTRIIKGEIPCYKLHEDELTFAFLDIHPVQPGHVLVVPKKQVAYVWDLPDQDYQALMAAAKTLAHHIRRVLEVPYMGEQIIGVDVPHAHVHLIPFTTVEEFRVHPDMTAEPDHEALARMAERLAL